MTISLGSPPAKALRSSKQERIFHLSVEGSTDPKGTTVSVEQGAYVRGTLLLDQIDTFYVLKGADGYLACLDSRVIS